MKKNQLLLLFGLGVILAVVAILVSRKQTAPYQQNAREGARLLPGLDINAVATLNIRAGSNTLTLAKQGDLWVVRQRGDYPANFSTISDLLRQFWSLKIARAVQTGPARLPMLGLAGVDKNSTLLEMKAADGKLIQSVLLGTNSLSESRGWPNGRYVMVDSDPKAVSYVADMLSSVDAAAEHWLNKDFFKVEKLKSIAISAPVASNNWQLARTTETAEWVLADAKPDEKLDSSKTSALGSLLTYPSFEDVVPAAAALDKPTVATLATFEGFTYTVKAAKKADDNYQLQVALTASLVRERTPGKDEKPEDKAKLDKEFKDNLQKLEQKLKTEQAYAGWTYTVTKWTIEQLLKDRKDFLAEKKPESKPPASTPDAKPALAP